VVEVALPPRIRDVAQLVGETLLVSVGAIDFDAAIGIAHRAAAVAAPTGGADVADVTDIEG
jgi:hypothetical protein